MGPRVVIKLESGENKRLTSNIAKIEAFLGRHVNHIYSIAGGTVGLAALYATLIRFSDAHVFTTPISFNGGKTEERESGGGKKEGGKTME